MNEVVGQADFARLAPAPERLREPLKRALAGARSEWPADLSPEELALLILHGVGPLAYASGQPSALRTEALRAAATEPLRLADLQEVLTALADAGVPALILKGSALAYDLYREPELRPRSDTDLLIEESALDTVRRVLTARGFTGHLTSGDEHGVRQATYSRRGPFGIEHAYDVHWSVTNTPLFASTLRFDELRARARPLPRIAPIALGLEDADALLLACIHRVAHHHDSDRLIWLFDIVLLRQRMTPEDHAGFWRLAAERGVVAVCRRSIELADEWTDVPPHDRAEEHLSVAELEREEPSRAFLDRHLTYGGVMLANLRALPWRARLVRLRQLAFPPAAFVQQTFGVRSRLALPWLYVYRGVRGVVRLFKRMGDGT